MRLDMVVIAVAVVLVATLSGCSHLTSTTPAPPPSPPADAAQLGVPKVIHSASGATATVTLHGVNARPFPGARASNMTSYLVLDVEIASTSSTPLPYGQGSFAFQYAGPPDDPYRPGDSNVYGVRPIDYRAFPDYLPEGPLPTEHHVRGTVALDGSPGEPLLVEMLDTDTDNVTELAEWLVTPT